MISIRKKLLSAFVEVTNTKAAQNSPIEKYSSTAPIAPVVLLPAVADKFAHHFDQLFKEANVPGPAYGEFANMVRVMAAVADERTRYMGAFAGLSVQGLDKNKLLGTAADYLRVLEADATNFNNTVDSALSEKVTAKQKDVQAKQQRIELLHREINDLQNQIQLLQLEIKENEEKIENNTGAYKAALEQVKQRLLTDIEKINAYIA